MFVFDELDEVGDVGKGLEESCSLNSSLDVVGGDAVDEDVDVVGDVVGEFD